MQPRGTTTMVIIFCLAGIFGAAWLTSRKPEKDLPTNRLVFQDRTNNCGAAVLKMIMNHFGYPISLRDLERKLILSSAGTSLQRIKEVAEEFGLRAHGWTLRREDLDHIQYPIILFLRRKHFIVADSLDRFGNLSVRDPAVGSLNIPQKSLADIWGGEALVFLSDTTSGIRTNEIVKKE